MRWNNNSIVRILQANLGKNSLKIRRIKTKYMEFNFSGTRDREGGLIIIGNDLIVHYDKFRYLGSMVESLGGWNLDITNRWAKRWQASRALCDRKVPLCLKEQFYKMVIRPAMLYGAKFWAMKKKMDERRRRCLYTTLDEWINCKG